MMFMSKKMKKKTIYFVKTCNKFKNFHKINNYSKLKLQIYKMIFYLK